MYSCKVERHSVSKLHGAEAVSFLITFPRRVLAETVTHRVNYDVWGDWECTFTERTATEELSKNSASSRAVPFDRMVSAVLADPFVPDWTANQRGMQGSLITDEATTAEADGVWLEFLQQAVTAARKLSGLGIHKQDCNRALENWAWVTQLVTGSRWDNFFALRCHEAADPHFRRVARMMFLAKRESVPVGLEQGQWHLPFVPLAEQMNFDWSPFSEGHSFTHPLDLTRIELPDLIKFSAARCARLSYTNHDGRFDQSSDLNLASKLLNSAPPHMSPFEHQLTPMGSLWSLLYPQLRSNAAGWLQARKLVLNEKTEVFNPSDEEIQSWNLD